MTGSKTNREGNSSDVGEPDPGPTGAHAPRLALLVGALLMFAALAIYVLTAISRGPAQPPGASAGSFNV